MKNRFYFLAGYHMLVFVHDETEDMLILGGVAHYLTDAKTNIMRQKIAKKNFRRYKPTEIDESNLEGYKFMKKEQPLLESPAWRVTDVAQNNIMRARINSYINLAEELPMKPLTISGMK